MSNEALVKKVALAVGDYVNGHTTYRSIYDAIRATLSAPEAEAVAWRWSESNGERWFDWRTDWTHHDSAKAQGFLIQYAAPSAPAANQQMTTAPAATKEG